MSEPELWMEGTKVAATLVAAGVAAWVAYSIGSSQRDIARRQAETATEQKRIAAAKLNLELFEERYKIFEAVQGFLARPRSEVNDTTHGDFTNLIPRAAFLFGLDIAKYMREAHRQRLAMDTHYAILRQSGDIVSLEDSKKIEALYQWFSDEASNCFQRFAPYLDFSNWKAAA